MYRVRFRCSRFVSVQETVHKWNSSLIQFRWIYPKVSFRGDLEYIAGYTKPKTVAPLPALSIATLKTSHHEQQITLSNAEYLKDIE